MTDEEANAPWWTAKEARGRCCDWCAHYDRQRQYCEHWGDDSQPDDDCNAFEKPERIDERI